jgi:hypothetical protein
MHKNPTASGATPLAFMAGALIGIIVLIILVLPR